jgi:hypothetical protein
MNLRMSHRAELARLVAVHAAVVVASWLFATLLYAVAIAGAPQVGWVAIDAAIVTGCVAYIHARRDALGFRALGARRGLKLLAIVLFATACVLVVQLVIRDQNGIWLDESNYLATVRAQTIVRHGRLPYNLRWLMPLLAGRWNILPVDDIDAVKALNFGAFAVTAAFLVLLLVRLRVRLGLALAAPVFLLCSYLGVYGASNRLVLDAFNYAMYVILFHLLIRRAHLALFGAVLLLSALNAEKAVYWVPVVILIELLRDAPAAGTRWYALHRRPGLRRALGCCAPTVLYLIAIRLYLAGSNTEWNLCFENIDVMSLSPLGAHVKNPAVRSNTFAALWLPFGPFTIYALLGFVRAPRWMKPIALLLVPIFIQNLIACDGERMVAYAFIVYLPFGYLYLAQVFGDLPRALGRALFGAMIVLAIAERYLLPVLDRLDGATAAAIVRAPNLVKLALSATEIALVATLVFVHATFFQRRPD